MSDIKFVDRQDSINLATQFGEYLYNRLPKVYRDYDVEIERLNVETQKKETFKTLQEYLYSFALGGFQPLLEDLEAIINLVDPFKCPSEFLPYLLRHFGLDYIDDIPEKFQRRLVQNVVTLYKKKGTIPAVAFLAKELSGFGVNIEEKSDGSIEFALIKLNAYEDEDAELLLAQDVIQRYIHLFLPAQTKSKIIVVYGFTENIHINPNGKSEDTTYDHAYYDVDEYEDITYIDENGYDSKTGGYSEAFDYLKHVVEDDFNALKLKLEEETHNFSPSLPDLTSLTNCVENDGLPVFTNGISCEDVITEQKLTSTTGEAEFNIPASTSNISVNKLVGGGNYAVLPIYKCTKDLMKGTTLEFKYDGKSYGYYTLERDLYASENFPTTFQLDIYNNMVKVYNQYFVETIDESYDFTLYSGYGSYYTLTKNGSVNTDYISDIRIKCDYDKEFDKMSSIYFQPTTTPRIAFRSDYVYISLSDVITSVESSKEFVKSYPITIISPASIGSTTVYDYTPPTGQTIAYKKLSSTPVVGSITIECTVYTMNDRNTIFAYESPVFIQNSNIAISGYYGLKTFPESNVISDSIQVTGNLKGVSLIDYKLSGNSIQNGTPSLTSPIEIKSVGDLVTDTSSPYYGKYDVPIVVCGKNMFDKVNGNIFNAYISSNTLLSYNPVAGSVVTACIECKPNTTYTVSRQVLSKRFVVASGKVPPSKNATLTTQINGETQLSISITTGAEDRYLYVWYYNKSVDTKYSYEDIVKGIQVEENSTATGYEPYSGNVNHIYLNEPLRSYGNYRDIVELDNNRVVRNLYSCKLNKDMNFNTYSYTGLSGVFVEALPFIGNRQKGICSYIPSNKIGDYYNSGAIWGGVNTGVLYLVGILNELGISTISEFKEWVGSLTTPFEIVFVRPSSIYEYIEVPDLITPDSDTMNMYLGTSVQPSNIDVKYYESTPIPQLSEIVYDLGIPLVSFDGYSESIEKIDGKYYLRSAIKEISVEYMYNNREIDEYNALNGYQCVDWFNLMMDSSAPYGTNPFYFNMSPCKYNVDPPSVSNGGVYYPNLSDVFDYMCVHYSGEKGGSWGNFRKTVGIASHFKGLSGYHLKVGLEYFRRIYNHMFRYSDIPPKFYVYDKCDTYGGETLTEITDKEVINKLNLLPIPEDYAIISSKGIKYSSMDVSVQSKRYY